jgi:hypothetical protein
MSLGHGSNIVRDGLVLHLDAANVKSYSGSGTTWSDLSGNGVDGTFVNGVGFSSENKGSMVFDGIDDYASVFNISQILEYTFMFNIRWLSSIGDRRPFGLQQYGTYTVHNPNNVGYHFNPRDGLDSTTTLSSGVNVGFGNWIDVAVSESRTSDVSKIYINGTLRNSFSRISTNGFVGTVNFGAQKIPFNYANSNISRFILYNRVLSDHEVRQNFEATRGRYGI